MKAELVQEAIAVANVVAEDNSRPIFTCVKIGNGEIVAADGYIMVRHPVKTEGEGEVMVRGKAILDARGVYPHGNLLLEQNGDEVTLKSTDPQVTDPSLIVRTTVVNAHFPAFDKLYPTSEPTAFTALAPGLLRKLLDAVGDASFIKFRIRGSRDPVEFIAGYASGLIMPMHIDDDDDWYKVKKVKE